MVASRAARERKAAKEAGPLANVRIEVDDEHQFAYKIACTECLGKRHRKWSAYRTGNDNGYLAAMDRWIFHLREKHPDDDSPCVGYLPQAQARLHEQRLRESSRTPHV